MRIKGLPGFLQMEETGQMLFYWHACGPKSLISVKAVVNYLLDIKTVR